MVSSGSQTLIDESDYDALESALVQTERGRRFLGEYARRHRGADTDTLLQAIARLESVVTKEAAPAVAAHDLSGDLATMAQSIARMRHEIAAVSLPDGQEGQPAATLDSLVRGAERATTEILGAAEAIQEAAWGLREKGADGPLCDTLDRRAIGIYTACSAQDLAAQRTGLVVATLQDIEARIAALLGDTGTPTVEEPAAPPPPLPEAVAEEHDLDFVPSQAQAAAAAPEPEPVIAEPDDDSDHLALAFGDLDSLSIEEKIALFS